MTSVRQHKSARLIQRELGEFFRRESRSSFDSAMISVTIVRMTPDLGLAKCYLSIFGVEDAEELLGKIRAMGPGIRRDLGNKIKKQVRHIPELYFYLDDSLDYAEQIDDLLKK